MQLTFESVGIKIKMCDHINETAQPFMWYRSFLLFLSFNVFILNLRKVIFWILNMSEGRKEQYNLSTKISSTNSFLALYTTALESLLTRILLTSESIYYPLTRTPAFHSNKKKTTTYILETQQNALNENKESVTGLTVPSSGDNREPTP